MRDSLLHDKAALVTGAASGIGRAAALAFARAGARVAVCDVDAAGAEATLAMLHRAGGDGIALTVDVSDEAAVATMVEAAVAAFGSLDCAFNNAGVLLEDRPRTDGKPAGWQEDVFERTWQVNAKGIMLCMKHEIEQMKRQGGGAIVNTASVEGMRGVPGHLSYSTSKHAVIGLTRGAALEVGRLGIRVNALCPGAIRTPMLDEALCTIGQERLAAYHPLGRIGEPEEVAAAAVWLCSADASFITGHALPVDGGMLCG